MRWHRYAVLLALAGCSGPPACTLVGCVSQLTVQLPAGTAAAQACIQGVCTSEIVDGALLVPLGRREEGGSATVTVTLEGSTTAYEGDVALTRSRPEGANCPLVCVSGTATVDLDAGRVVSAG